MEMRIQQKLKDAAKAVLTENFYLRELNTYI